MASILIVEDDISFSQLLENFLRKNGYAVHAVANVRSAKAFLLNEQCDLILLDYRLPDGIGTDVLDFLREGGLQTQSIVMTSFHDIRTAVRTIRMGAVDYITKPVNPDELILVITDALQKKDVKQSSDIHSFLKGTGTESLKLYQYIELVAPTDFSVIIQGESGTGKELAARQIHDLSKRKNKPFVALDCGALSVELAGSELFGHVKGAFTGAIHNKRGLFEEAKGGTVFLDEVGNLSYEVQVKLLRAIQEREIQPIGSNSRIKIDVRIICATNDDLIKAVKEGRFREDLYHRLNEFKIRIPSLNERKEDLQLFIDFFIKQTNNELSKDISEISPKVKDIFEQYDWPGNLRELKNTIKRAVLLATDGKITTHQLPHDMLLPIQESHPKPGLRSIQETNEKEQIIEALNNARYNKTKAAKLLNIDRTTLYYKMAKYNID